MYGTATRLFHRPVDRWDATTAARLSGRDEVIYRAHLVGGDRALTREGGGNASAKGFEIDHRGSLTRVLWMSAWGCDCATATEDDFPALRLDDLLLSRDSGPMSETEMIDYLAACGMLGEQRRPGIETLTHAFIPATYVDHCHPDAVIALTSFPEGREWAENEFGDEAIWFDYRQFDVDVARELADRIEADPRCRFVLLANHGLFTWADDSESCYRNTLEAVERATLALDRATNRRPDLGGRATEPLPEDVSAHVLGEILPVLRGALSAESAGTILHVDRSARAVEFASSARGPELALRGPACPDHIVTAGYRPLVLDAISTPDNAAMSHVLDGVRQHRQWYESYYERHITAAGRALGRRDSAPHVIVLPGIGVVCAGIDAAKARLCADHFEQTMTVVRGVDAAGEYVSLTEAQGVADEYWPLMRLKPQLRSAQGALAGRIVLVASEQGDGRDAVATADALAAQEAHVVIAGADPARAAEADLVGRYAERRVVIVPGTFDGPGLLRDAVLVHGGFDVVIDLTRQGRVVPSVLPVFARQGLGGLVVLVRPAAGGVDPRPEAARLTADGLPEDVHVSVIVADRPDAIGEAAAFLAASRTWRSAVVDMYPEQAEEVT
jgi:rhamnose utilization protein RhaD (predicted bifunctional aldolase and dehydrogenase)